MSSIPLPALDLKPVQPQPGPMEQYGNLLRLQAMQNQNQQQQAEAPLRQQAMQNQNQLGALQVQQQQQALNDQKAMTTAMQQWDGKDVNDLLPLVLKNGGSAQAVMGLKKNALDMQTQVATAAKNNAQAAEAQVAATKNRNDMVTGALSPLLDAKQVPDAALPQTLLSTVQSLQEQGLIDPAHAQKAAALAQSGDPQAIRSGVDQFSKTLMAQSQIMDQGLKQAQTTSAQTATDKNRAEAEWYSQNGGAPGVPVEAMQQADWLSKHPGKGPADFLLWKARNSPVMMMQSSNMLSPQGTQLAAQNFLQTGQSPQGMYRSPGTTAAVINQAADMNAQQGGPGLAANKADYEANKKSLDNLKKNYDQVQAFELTAEKNIDLLQQTAQNIPDLGSRFANVPVRMLKAKMQGTPEMAAFNTALNTAQTEAAKVLNSSNATGVLSDSARHELQQIVDGDMPYKSMVASLNTLRQDMANRTQGYQHQIADIRGRIENTGNPQPQSAPEAPPDNLVQSMKEGQYIHGPGGSYQKKGGVLVKVGQ